MFNQAFSNLPILQFFMLLYCIASTEEECKICPEVWEPVCGNYDGFVMTYPSRCVLDFFKCDGDNVTFLHNGECRKCIFYVPIIL